MFDFNDVTFGSLTSGLGRLQSEKDITSASRSHTEPKISVLVFQPINPLSLFLSLQQPTYVFDSFGRKEIVQV
jgi:hypothetical protein